MRRRKLRFRLSDRRDTYPSTKNYNTDGAIQNKIGRMPCLDQERKSIPLPPLVVQIFLFKKTSWNKVDLYIFTQPTLPPLHGGKRIYLLIILGWARLRVSLPSANIVMSIRRDTTTTTVHYNMYLPVTKREFGMGEKD